MTNVQKAVKHLKLKAELKDLKEKMNKAQIIMIKAEAKKQIRTIKSMIMFPEMYESNTDNINEMKRRRTFLNFVVSAPDCEFSQKAFNFVFGK